MGSDETIAEIREFPRASTNCTIDYQLVQEVGSELSSKGHAVNVSGGGLCFTTYTPLPVDCMVALKINVPELPNQVVALARVAWSRPQGNTGRHDNGVEFWWMGWSDPEAQSTMMDYVTGKLEGQGA